MKKTLFFLTGFAWGIYFSNDKVLVFAITLSIATILINAFVGDEYGEDE